MSTNKLHIMHSMCQSEIELLKSNLDHFLADSLKAQNAIEEKVSINGSESNNKKIFSLLAFDSYMSRMSTVFNHARKFNILLQLNNLKSSADESWMQKSILYKYFVQSNDQEYLNTEMACVNSLAIGLPIHKTAETAISKNISGETTPETYANNIVNIHVEPPVVCHPPVPEKDLSYFVEGYKFTATITYVEDYRELVFYVCEVNNLELFELSDMHHLHDFIGAPAINEIYGISMNGGSIMRALKYSENEVLLVDIGAVVILNDKWTIYQLPTRYQDIPPQAIKCILEGTNEPPCVKDSDHNYLANVLEHNELKKLNFKVVRKVDKVLFLRLYDNDPVLKWKDFMKHQKKSRISVNPFKTEHTELIDLQTTLECKHSTENTLIPTRIREMPHSSVSKSASDITEFTTELLDEGSVIKITVTFIVGATSFYAQIENDSLCHTLYWHNDVIQSHQRLVKLPAVNELVLAQYSKDEMWYRAKVLHIDHANEICKVFYVDYGNTETVTLAHLAKCMPAVEIQPFRAVLFHLAGVCDITTDNELRHRQAVQSLVVIIMSQTFNVKLLQRTGNELSVTIEDEEFKNVPSILLSMGYVKEV